MTSTATSIAAERIAANFIYLRDKMRSFSLGITAGLRPTAHGDGGIIAAPASQSESM